MDACTADYYHTHAHTLALTYDTARTDDLFILLQRHLSDRSRVLEIGVGSGRDAAFMVGRLGCDVLGVDGSEAMIREALSFHPELSHRLHCAPFPFPKDSWMLEQRFEAIVSIATLMHIPDEDLFEAACQLRELLEPGGLLILSASIGRPNLAEGRDSEGRLMLERPPDELQLLFERLGFRLLTRTEDTDGLERPIRWFTLVMQRAEAGAARSLDALETIITRDKKVATYKLALLRALCEIARHDARLVRWRLDGWVAVPLGLVAEKWLFYYWPLVAEDDLMCTQVAFPQQRGREVRQKLAFRKPMRQLIETYKVLGRRQALYHDYRASNVPPVAQGLLDQVLNKIANTIVAGPVTYAGGALEGEGGFFRFEGPRTAKNRCVAPASTCASLGDILVPVGAWREMCFIGHWVAESLILRWAELTHEISGETVTIAQVAEKLLETPENARDVSRAKQVYQNMDALRCVWTDEALSKGFDVDHAVPFSIWRSNDLWNLLPTAPQINRQKSDRLVTKGLLLRRRDAIIHCWTALRTDSRERFGVEVTRALLRGPYNESGWERQAFAGLIETVETLAIQRGLLRWEP